LNAKYKLQVSKKCRYRLYNLRNVYKGNKRSWRYNNTRFKYSAALATSRHNKMRNTAHYTNVYKDVSTARTNGRRHRNRRKLQKAWRIVKLANPFIRSKLMRHAEAIRMYRRRSVDA
jgi:hypothetical protein